MTSAQLRAIPVALFPVVLVAGIVTIPVVTDYSNHELAAQAASHTARWFWGHIISAAAFGLAVLAACSIAGYLRAKRQARLGALGLTLMAVGGALYAAGLGADGIGPIASAAGGGTAEAFFEGSGAWITGVFVTAAMTFGLGLMAHAAGLLRAGLLKQVTGIIVFAGAIAFAGAAAIPSGWGLYVVAAAVLAVYVPISAAMWREVVPQ
jgi:hypothetical protein